MRLAGVTFLSIAAFGLFLASVVEAEDGRAVLLRDLVRVEQGQLVYDDLGICQVEAPGTQGRKIQVRSRATAPEKGLISRDYFVALVTRLESDIVRPALGSLRCEPLEKPIGQVDVEVTMTMTAEGIQYEYKDTAKGTVNRSSNTWKDLFPSE